MVGPAERRNESVFGLVAHTLLLLEEIGSYQGVQRVGKVYPRAPGTPQRQL